MRRIEWSEEYKAGVIFNRWRDDAIIVIAEEGVELFADVAGLTTINFQKGRLGKRKKLIMAALRAAYEQAQNFYDDL